MDGITEIVNPGWIQAGELGIAFVLVFALLFFVRDMMKKSADREDKLVNREEKLAAASAAREEKLMEFIFAIQPTLENIAMRLADLEAKFLVSQRIRQKWESESED